MNELTQDDAIKIKALKLCAYLHTHNKNLTAMQLHLNEALWDVLGDWDYVKEHLHEYNLDGVRRKE